MLDAAKSKAEALKAGSHEWTARAGLQNRSVKNGSDSREWETALERAIRLPGKARLDDSLGQSLMQQAEFAVGDAMHESAKDLLKNWLDYARARETARVWEEQITVLKKQLDIVDKRIRAGDAPKLEREAARAALSQSQSQAARALMQRESALSLLKARYPQLTMIAADMPEPIKVEGTLEIWRTAMLEDNHELAYQQAAAIRADAVRARLSQEAEIQYLGALHSREAWLNAKESLLAFRQQADGAARAYQLGEGSLSDTLTARRLALEAQLNEIGARADALESNYRLKLDAHQLWPFHQSE